MKSTIEFFKPLIKYPYWTLAITAFIVSILHTGLAGLVEQNSYDLHMLAAEQLNELGPDYADESEFHEYIIKQYADHLEQRHLAILLRLLYPTYSPRNALASASLDLERLKNVADDKKEEAAKEAIWQAGLAGNQLYTLTKRFPWSPVTWFNPKDLPDWLSKDLDEALAKSHELVGELEKDQTLKAAVEACRANRRAMLLLFLARSKYDDDERIKIFLYDVERARDQTLLLAEKVEGDTELQELLYETATSEGYRVKIINAMLANNMDEVCKLLKEAVNRAFEREQKQLG